MFCRLLDWAEALNSRPWLAPSRTQLFFKRSTLYVPFVLVGAYFANEVSNQEHQRAARASRRGLLQRRSRAGFGLRTAANSVCSLQCCTALVSKLWDDS